MGIYLVDGDYKNKGSYSLIDAKKITPNTNEMMAIRSI